jgi:putative ABC transport system substrate-binding protein
MRRRGVLAMLGSAAVLPPRRSSARSTAPRIGVLVPEGADAFLRRFRPALREFGYDGPQTLQLEVRSADGNEQRLPELAAELVSQPVDLIVARLTPAVAAAKAATRDIPIVMAGAGDPVRAGLIASLARPGGNVTGVAGAAAQLAGKLVELIRDMLPTSRHIGVLANATDPFTVPFLDEIRASAQAVRLETGIDMIRSINELEAAFVGMETWRPDALVVQPSLHRPTAARLAIMRRLPALSPIGAFAAEGGLIGYASNAAELYRQTAIYVDRILKGSKPADLPVSQSSRFDLIVNVRTARAINFIVPPPILARADEVIE